MGKSRFLNFGQDHTHPGIHTYGALEFLRGEGFAGGSLEQGRRAVRDIAKPRFVFESHGANYCDFCFTRLTGIEYDRLTDGRERCVRCSKSVIRDRDEFVEIFTRTRQYFELLFDVNVSVPMKVRMLDAREIARRTSEKFEPKPGVSARVIGFASYSKDGFELVIENGSPVLATISTIAHELTHIWQYQNWGDGRIQKMYGAATELTIREGMATWAEVQYLYGIKELEYAERQESYAHERTDEYGVGFRMFEEKYPLRLSNNFVNRNSPFQRVLPLS